jgi:T-box
MFPTIRVCFSGLDPRSWYLVYVDIVPLDDKRYRYSYHKSRWVEAGSRIELPHAAAEQPYTAAIYQGTWVRGEQLNRQLVSFDRIKLTNNATNKKCGHVSKKFLRQLQVFMLGFVCHVVVCPSLNVRRTYENEFPGR